MKKSTLLLLVAVFALISCSKEEQQEPKILYTKEYFEEVLLFQGECCPGPDEAQCYDCGRDK